MVIIVMGAAGAGKTTIGQALAAELGWPFVEGDDYHPPANVRKMRDGVALTDADRAPWLSALAAALGRALDRREHTVFACSALKQRYRIALRDGRRSVRFVYLEASEALLAERVKRRAGHFFNPALVGSQLAALEAPDDPQTVTLDAARPPEEILWSIRRELGV